MQREYSRLKRLLQLWQKEKETNQYNMQRHADRAIALIESNLARLNRKSDD